MNEIIGILENPHLAKHGNISVKQVRGCTYKFCIHQRDWKVGDKILDNISNSIQDSYRTIVLLSNSFLASRWCQHEFDEAYKENKLIVIMMNDENVLNFDKHKTIKSYVECCTYLDREDSNLWKKLAYCLPYKNTDNDSQGIEIPFA